ncbi:hypothetical protein [Lachnoclostridium phytofermentans]|uniref:hypothetical protein n=1 Tax=Lachnoclostridium phytofermentans TaxID=66219 RepID=UPI00068D4862|nr:hypothetical protein [Lachnoclostridium phytofermentans]
MEYKVNYQDDAVLRSSFHALTQKVFHFQLKDWYDNGYWSELYEPHSIIEGDSVIANISANHMAMTIPWDEKEFSSNRYRNDGSFLSQPRS